MISIKENNYNIDENNKKEVYNFILSKENPLYLCGYLVKERGFKKYFPELYKQFLEYKLDKNLSFKEKLYLFLNNEYEPHHCKICSNYVTFGNFINGYHTYCSPICELKDPDVVEKFKNTNIEKYGFEYPAQSEFIKEKSKQICLEKYGVEYTGQTECKKQHTKETCLKKYGKEYYLQTKESRIKSKQTCIKKYGTEYPTQNKLIKEKIINTKIKKYGNANYINIEKAKNTCLKKYGETNYMKTKEGKLKIRNTILKKYGDYSNRIQNNAGRFKGTSKSEKELIEFIKTIYNKEIITNNRYKFLNDLELDIYLPQNKIGIEFNGDYWHMNPSLYKANVYNKALKCYAKDVWNKDNNKKQLCNKNNIELIVVWEYDWKNNKDNVKDNIIKKLELN